MSDSPVSMLVRDAGETSRRIRRDVARLADLGKLAVAGLRAAAARARVRAERLIDEVGDEIEKTTRGPRGGRF